MARAIKTRFLSRARAIPGLPDSVQETFSGQPKEGPIAFAEDIMATQKIFIAALPEGALEEDFRRNIPWLAPHSLRCF